MLQIKGVGFQVLFLFQVFTCGLSLMLLNALMEVTCIADITCITQVTFTAVHNALLVNDWRFWFVYLNNMLHFPVGKDWLDFFIVFTSY